MQNALSNFTAPIPSITPPSQGKTQIPQYPNWSESFFCFNKISQCQKHSKQWRSPWWGRKQWATRAILYLMEICSDIRAHKHLAMMLPWEALLPSLCHVASVIRYCPGQYSILMALIWGPNISLFGGTVMLDTCSRGSDIRCTLKWIHLSKPLFCNYSHSQ